MGMYNLMFGENPAIPIILEILGMKKEDFGRFRDAWVEDGGKKIVVLTRNGGGNREWLEDYIERLREHPLYIRDYDDDFDCTYAYFEFRVPDEHLEITKDLAERQNEEYSKSLYERVEAFCRGLDRQGD